MGFAESLEVDIDGDNAVRVAVSKRILRSLADQAYQRSRFAVAVFGAEDQEVAGRCTDGGVKTAGQILPKSTRP